MLVRIGPVFKSEDSSSPKRKNGYHPLIILGKMGCDFGEVISVSFTSTISKDVGYTEELFNKGFTSRKVKTWRKKICNSNFGKKYE